MANDIKANRARSAEAIHQGTIGDIGSFWPVADATTIIEKEHLRELMAYPDDSIGMQLAI